MKAARCWWPVLDPDMGDRSARAEAVAQLPRIGVENHWTAYGEPTNWRYQEGFLHGERTLYLICDIEVVVAPQPFRHPSAGGIGAGGCL